MRFPVTLTPDKVDGGFVVKQEGDNKFLELAFSGNADCIITGDQDLLVLNPFREIPIITPRKFLSWRIETSPPAGPGA